MKRFSHARRAKLLRHLERVARKRAIKRLRSHRRYNEAARIARVRRRRPMSDRALFEASAIGVPPLPLRPSRFQAKSGKWWRCFRLTAPEDFRAEENPAGVMQFVYELRRQVLVNDRFRGVGTKLRPSLYIDFDEIRKIDLSGALILAAEIDRIRQILGIKVVLDDGAWDPDVRATLSCLGLNRVVEATTMGRAEELPDFTAELAAHGIAIVPFVSCHQADPTKAQELLNGLVQHCARDDAAGLAVYESLVEAFSNAVQHAYRDDVEGDGLPSVHRWWAGAIVDKLLGYVDLVVYDQGVGIPRTLARRPFWHIIALKVPEHTDARLIEAALDYGRSGTTSSVPFLGDAGGRGNGLWRMCQMTEAFDEAYVRFTSLKGEVTYNKGGRQERTELSTRFCGTMVRWRAKITPTEG